jgi:hypothetical protein
MGCNVHLVMHATWLQVGEDDEDEAPRKQPDSSSNNKGNAAADGPHKNKEPFLLHDVHLHPVIAIALGPTLRPRFVELLRSSKFMNTAEAMVQGGSIAE